MKRVLKLTERSSSNSFFRISLSFFSFLDSIEISMLFYGGSVCVSVVTKFDCTTNSNFVETLFSFTIVHACLLLAKARPLKKRCVQVYINKASPV
jgi:hypothetical protein